MTYKCCTENILDFSNEEGNGHYPAGPAMKKLSLFLLTLACVFQFSAQAQERPSYIAIEANSGKLLFSSNAEEKGPWPVFPK